MTFLSEAAVEQALLEQLRGLGVPPEARQSRGALAQLRDTLLPKLISGELRVSDVDGFIARMESESDKQNRSVS
ncbi:MAG: restriction endonuclease subunit S [Burkholderiaceae bacterium]